jgi:hypothetical protein
MSLSRRLVTKSLMLPPKSFKSEAQNCRRFPAGYSSIPSITMRTLEKELETDTMASMNSPATLEPTVLSVSSCNLVINSNQGFFNFVKVSNSCRRMLPRIYRFSVFRDPVCFPSQKNHPIAVSFGARLRSRSSIEALILISSVCNFPGTLRPIFQHRLLSVFAYQR